MLRGLRDDLYVSVSTIDPSTRRATFSFHVNPMVSWIWVGTMIMMIGSVISLWPEARLRDVGVWSFVRATVGGVSVFLMTLLFATSPARVLAAQGIHSVPANQGASFQSSWDPYSASPGAEE